MQKPSELSDVSELAAPIDVSGFPAPPEGLCSCHLNFSDISELATKFVVSGFPAPSEGLCNEFSIVSELATSIVRALQLLLRGGAVAIWLVRPFRSWQLDVSSPPTPPEGLCSRFEFQIFRSWLATPINVSCHPAPTEGLLSSHLKFQTFRSWPALTTSLALQLILRGCAVAILIFRRFGAGHLIDVLGPPAPLDGLCSIHPNFQTFRSWLSLSTFPALQLLRGSAVAI